MDRENNQRFKEEKLTKDVASKLNISLKKTGAEVSDDELAGAAGGAVLEGGEFYLAVCTLCGWRSSLFDGKSGYDPAILAVQHMEAHPGCAGDFVIYKGNVSDIILG